ncbi:MAG TPA: hypothetical protein P5081_11565 [Phycisphaerae bacterium]|nr:hypothetical protein [Phycisphaerae bacterium]HRW53518.1 hypothetical protein [Phycisphaerae bacterium]
MLAQPHAIHYLPLLTTCVSIAFFFTLIQRYRMKKRGAHLLWWAAGVACYGLGTAIESSITVFGNSVFLTKSWFIAGALLGGYPLAQGTVYLLLRRRTANRLTLLTVPIIVVAAVCVALSPVDLDSLQAARPSGSLLQWQWIRSGFTPIINVYSLVFLVGGAMLSAIRFGRFAVTRHRAIGNTLIAIGAFLPAIGGGMTKFFELVEALYVAELAGLVMIWFGYASCVHRPNGVSQEVGDLTAVRPATIPSRTL